MTTRLIPPALNAATQNIRVYGRTYSAAPGAVVDCPDGDAAALASNGWLRVASSGPTGSRPTNTASIPGGEGNVLYTGMRYLDTTLGYIIIFDGAAWRNPSTGASV